MKSQSKDKQQNNPSISSAQQQLGVNQEALMMNVLFNFVKHSTIMEIAEHFHGKYFESKKQKKLIKKMKQQMELLKKHVRQLSKELKTHRTNEPPPLRLIKSIYKNKN